MKKFLPLSLFLLCFAFHFLQASIANVSFSSLDYALNPRILENQISQASNSQGLINQSFGPLLRTDLFNPPVGTTYVNPRIGSFDSEPVGITLQPDGKIILAGSSAIGGIFRFSAVRFLENSSTLDFSFGTNGKFYGPVIGANATSNECRCLALQSDGKIILAGTTTIGGPTYFALMRLTTSGTLDTTFANGVGYTYISSTIAGGANDTINCIVIQSDNKIIVAGRSNNNFALARYTENGILDTTFGNNGTTYITPRIITGGIRDIVHAIGLQSDDKIIVAGQSLSNNFYFSCARFTTAGLLDATFANNGSTFLTPTIGGGTINICRSLYINSDDSFILGGYADNGIATRFALAGYTKNGILNPNFGTNGTVFLSFNIAGGVDDNIFALQPQSDGKLIASGYSSNGVNARFAFARFTTNGFLDTTFGSSKNGTVFLSNSIAGGSDICYGLAPTVNTFTAGGGSNNYFALAQYSNIPTQQEFQSIYYGQAGLVA